MNFLPSLPYSVDIFFSVPLYHMNRILYSPSNSWSERWRATLSPANCNEAHNFHLHIFQYAILNLASKKKMFALMERVPQPSNTISVWIILRRKLDSDLFIKTEDRAPVTTISLLCNFTDKLLRLSHTNDTYGANRHTKIKSLNMELRMLSMLLCYRKSKNSVKCKTTLKSKRFQFP